MRKFKYSPAPSGRGHGLHGRRKLVDPVSPPAKKLQQIWEGYSRASRGCNLRPIYATIAREWENSSIPQRLDEARASQIWVQHTPNPYTSVHNAASTDEAQTFWGSLQSYKVSDGTAFRAAGVRLKKMRGSGFRCETDHSIIHSFMFWIHVRWSLRKPRVS